jgi:hypothetical protein
MSLHINRFVDSIKAHESRGQKDFTMPLKDAKDLHADITKLLVTMEILREHTQTISKNEITLDIDGGTF